MSNAIATIDNTNTMNIKPGDRVAYSVQWLKSVGLSHSDAARERGVVKELIPLGNNHLAVVDWAGESPPKVLTSNLTKVGLNTKFSNC